MVTKEMLKTWRNANSAVWVTITGGNATVSYSTKIKADGFDAAEVTASFNSFKAHVPDGYKKAFAHESIYKFAGECGNFAALRMLLKDGDDLFFHARDNSNNYCKAAEIPSDKLNTDGDFHHPDYHGLHDDVMFVDIIRNNKTILRDFIVDYSVCPDNSARLLNNN